MTVSAEPHLSVKMRERKKGENQCWHAQCGLMASASQAAQCVLNDHTDEVAMATEAKQCNTTTFFFLFVFLF